MSHSPKVKEKKGTLTLKQLNDLYKEAKKYEDKPEFCIVFKRRFPFISFEWFYRL